jgi:dTMP kinase
MNGNRGKLIVFEGLDGAGKSTAAQAAAKALGAVFMTTPSPRVREYRDDLITGFKGSQEAQQFFYLATVFAASREIAALLAEGRTVVLDRYFLSTQAYAAFRGSGLALDDVQALLVPADLTVFVEAPLETRRSRLAARGTSAADRETLSPAANARLLHEHLARAHLPVVGKFLRLDTSVLSPEDVARAVTQAID